MARNPLKLLAFAALAMAANPAPAQNTKFLAWDDESSEYGDWAVQKFKIPKRTQYRLRTATDYKADVAVIPQNQLGAFQDGDDFFGWGFDDAYGNKTVTLNAGTYYLAVRNQVEGSNYVRVELDTLLTIPGFAFSSWGIYDTDYLEPGYSYWSKFNAQKNVRLFLDGANTGLETYVVAKKELSRFIAGKSFRYYAAYSKVTTDMPGFYELKLPVGEYALCFYNDLDFDLSFTYEAERWVKGRTPSAPLAPVGPAPEVGQILTRGGASIAPSLEPSPAIAVDTERTHRGITPAWMNLFGPAKSTRLDPLKAKPEPAETPLARAFGAAPSVFRGR